MIVPGNLKNIVKHVNKFTDHQVSQKIAKPHRILKLRFSLKTIAEIASLKYIKENVDTKVSECQRFMYLYEKEYSMPIMLALFTQKERAYTVEELLEQDVKAVRSY